jgi:hypothetical protein
MTQFSQDNPTYQEMEPFIEAIVNDPLPDGLVEPEWLEMPELEPEWLEMPELEPEWLHIITPTEPKLSLDMPDLEQDLDLEH